MKFWNDAFGAFVYFLVIIVLLAFACITTYGLFRVSVVVGVIGALVVTPFSLVLLVNWCVWWLDWWYDHGWSGVRAAMSRMADRTPE